MEQSPFDPFPPGWSAGVHKKVQLISGSSPGPLRRDNAQKATVHVKMLLVILTLLHHPHSSQEGRGQKVTAPPPPGRSALQHGVRVEEQGYFLGGNN